MAELDSLLLQLFERLRREGVPLGVSDYVVAIELIQAGFGLEDVDSLKGLCRLLWAKSREDQELCDQAFEKLVKPQLKTTPEPENTSGTNTNLPPQDSQPSTATPDSTPKFQPQKQRKPQPTKLKMAPGTENQPIELKSDLPKATRHYQLTPRLPMSLRDMAAGWRQLRRPQRVGVSEELDIEGTINSISRTGLLLRPVFQPRRRNQARLVVLVDQQGSMAPFALLIEATKESILRGGLLGKTSLYYFHDCPEGYLYQRPSLTNALPLPAILDEQAQGNSVLIISDAGAARGYYDGTRVKDTKVFLQTLRSYTYLYAWLNPMPKNRWAATTAEDIACMVPMYPLNREGLNDAVNILRGFPFPVGVTLNE